MYYYQFNIGDYKSHTEHLEPIEDIAYRRMLDWSYLHEKSLPDDIGEIARLIRMRTHSDSIAIVLKEFFEHTEDGYINRRVMDEINKYKDKSEKASNSAKSRWNKKKTVDANALQPDSEGNAIHKPLTDNQEPLNNNHKPENIKKPKEKSIKPECISDQLFKDWTKHRGKNPITPTVIQGFEREAKKAGICLEAAVTESIERSWRGFNAKWYLNGKGNSAKGENTPSFQATDYGQSGDI